MSQREFLCCLLFIGGELDKDYLPFKMVDFENKCKEEGRSLFLIILLIKTTHIFVAHPYCSCSLVGR